jgi:hypothetical protein
LLVAALAHLLRDHLALPNGRLAYAEDRLAGALVAIALFTALLSLAPVVVARGLPALGAWPTRNYLAGITAVFAVYWLPAWLAGGFVADDWPLLAAASIRKVILLHPSYSWSALDSVDGNFRPLGAVLYFAYMLRWFGLAARAFTLGPLLLTLIASFVSFAIVRELGHSKLAAAAAAILYITRGVLYTIVTWTAALGDGIAILGCGLTALLVLKANKRSGVAACGCHLLAWLCFCVAILGKQSAFVAPLIVALALFLHPGQPHRPTLGRRTASALAALIIYAATAAAIFLHARDLSRGGNPYPIHLSLKPLFGIFSYATWYLFVFQLPDRLPSASVLPSLLGLAIIATFGVLACKRRAVLGDRARDPIFAALAAAASLSIFALLGTRSAPYYGCMFAFWLSIALGIVLTGNRWGSDRAADRRGIVFCLLILSGFAEIRLEQLALIPSGGYLWGTYGMDGERRIRSNMQHQLAASKPIDTLVFEDCTHASPYTSMALLEAPAIPRILVYDSRTNSYAANDRLGLRPVDSLTGLSEPRTYNWNQPLDATTAARILSSGRVLRVECANL